MKPMIGFLGSFLSPNFCIIEYNAKSDTEAPMSKIANTKHQITNKSQITISNDQNTEFELLRSSVRIIFAFGILNFGSAFGG